MRWREKTADFKYSAFTLTRISSRNHVRCLTRDEPYEHRQGNATTNGVCYAEGEATPQMRETHVRTCITRSQTTVRHVISTLVVEEQI